MDPTVQASKLHEVRCLLYRYINLVWHELIKSHTLDYYCPTCALLDANG